MNEMEKICLQEKNRQEKNRQSQVSKTETTLILSGYSRELVNIIPFNQYGLYRDDGLAMISGSGPEMDRLRKDIIQLFKGMNLKVTIETNLLITDYLDVSFNLTDGSFTPYTKPGNNIRYISSNSNHPPHIKKQIPRMVKDRLSLLSSNEQIFENEAPLYRKALLEAGYNDEIKYEKISDNK